MRAKPINLLDRIGHRLKKKEARPRERHYPSDVTACLRKLYYQWTSTAASNPIDVGGLLKMEMGKSIHLLMDYWLKEIGIDPISEVGGRKEVEGLQHAIGYRLDNMFIEEDGQIAGVETKSSYGRGIVEIQKSGKPRDDHLAQVCLYMELEHIPRFYLIYLGRDNAYRTQFVVEYRGDVLCANGTPFPDITFDNLIARLALLEKHLEDKEIPHREYRVAIKNGEIKDRFQKNKIVYATDWQCSYCQWKDSCWKDVVGIYATGDNSEMFPEKA